MTNNYQEIQSRLEKAKSDKSKKLNLSNLDLVTIPDEVWELTHIENLILSFNKRLQQIPPDIAKMKNLEKIALMGCTGLKGLPKEFTQLENLKSINAAGWKLNEIPPEIYNLKNLTELELTGNGLQRLSSDISKLENLKILNLSGNQLTELPKEISKLKKLQVLGLSANKLKRLPSEITTLDNLFGKKGNTKKNKIMLKSNPLIEPPYEVALNGFFAIKDYFDSLSKAKEINHLYEAKVIFVGEGEVGKTSLAKTLTNPNYELEKEQRTEGIDILDWNVPVEKFEFTDSVNLHLWDFGGQEIYHSTHQFFLTTRSIYLFVLNPRREENVNTYYYWLNIIKLLGGDSPVIVVINKSDLYDREFTVNEFKAFNDRVIVLIKTSCETKEGIEKLKLEIKNCLQNLDHLGTPLDKRWLDVRKQLELIKNLNNKDFLPLSEYEVICKGFGLDSEDIRRLSDIFHTLGIFIHYQDDIRLQNIVILNPEWATEGVYKILDNSKVKNNNGRFSDRDLEIILTDSRYKYQKAELLALMKKFELCFELTNGGEYLAPQLLSKQSINYQWDNKNNIYYEYKYEFMPKGLLSHFIVKQNEDIFQDNYWLNGVVLEWNDTKALVTEHYIDKKIKIVLQGDKKKHFLAIIRKTIFDIHKRFHNLEFSELLGCVCLDCSKSENPYLFSLQTIKNAFNRNIKNLQCQKSFDSVNLQSLLSNIEEIKEEDGLQGSFFESIVKNILQNLYPDATIQQSVIIDGYEFDFIVTSNAFKEFIVVEAKGYKAKKKIDIGDKDTKQTINWFWWWKFLTDDIEIIVVSEEFEMEVEHVFLF